MSQARSLVVFGASETAELADYYFTLDQGRPVDAFVLDDEFAGTSSAFGRPVVARSELRDAFPPSSTDFFAAIAYRDMNAIRRDRVRWAREAGYGLASYVSPRACVFPNAQIGEHCFILENNVIQPFVQILDNAMLWSGNHIGHHSVIGEDVFLASHVVVSGNCTVGAGSFLGVNATIRDGVTLGERTLVGAGALVLRDTQDEAVLAGPGTRVASTRSSEIPVI